MGARALRVERRITPPSVASPDAVAVCVGVGGGIALLGPPDVP